MSNNIHGIEKFIEWKMDNRKKNPD